MENLENSGKTIYVASIEHFIFSCPLVQTFWTRLWSWFEQETDSQLQVSLRSFLFCVNSVPQAGVPNLLLTFMKFYMYRQKFYHQGIFPLIHFLQELRTRLAIEKHICASQNKASHFRQWQHIYSALG